MKIATRSANVFVFLACHIVVSCKSRPTNEGTSAAASASAAPSISPSAARATIRNLQQQALALSSQHDFQGAKAKIIEAQTLAPADPDLKAGLAWIEEMQGKLVAGQWLKETTRDAMTDKDNVFVTLAAANDVDAIGGNKRPTLTARCVKGDPSLLLSVDSVLDVRSFPKTHVQYRFDSEPPLSVGVEGSTDMRAFFMDGASRWFDQLVTHASGRLVVEVPLFGRTPQPVTFQLAGADVAIRAVKAACPK